MRKFDKDKLQKAGIRGPMVRELQEKGQLLVDGKLIRLDEVSWIRQGDSIAFVTDTRYCDNAVYIARNARLFLCESTYLDENKDLAYDHYHLTAKQAATIAKEAQAKEFGVTHFSARYLNPQAFEAEARPIFPNTHIAEDFKNFLFPK